MNDKERLIEIIQNSVGGCVRHWAEIIADGLIEHGVIVPPCKVGDMVYVIKYCRCSRPECFTEKHCHKKVTKKTPKEYGRVMKQQNGRKLKPNIFGRIEYEWRPIGTICHIIYRKPFDLSMLTEIGKTVFLTREEAEKKLEEMGK